MNINITVSSWANVHIHIYQGSTEMSEALDRAEAKITELGNDITDLETLVAHKDTTIAEKQALLDSGSTAEQVQHLTDEITALDEKIKVITTPTATPSDVITPAPDGQ